MSTCNFVPRFSAPTTSAPSPAPCTRRDTVVFPSEIEIPNLRRTTSKGVINCKAGPTIIKSAKTGEHYEFTFNAPIYYFIDGMFNANMTTDQSLLISKDDFMGNSMKAGIVQTFHPGAFGREYSLMDVSLVPDELKGHQWYIVWKFPTDLNGIENFVPIDDGEPVGEFPLTDDSIPDSWSGENKTKFLKMRYSTNQGPAIHHLVNRTNQKKYPMITSGVFYTDFDHPTYQEQTNVKQMLEKFKELLDLNVIQVNCMHHAIVIKSTGNNEMYISPTTLAQNLNYNQEFYDTFTSIVKEARLESRHSENDIDLWAQNYITKYM